MRTNTDHVLCTQQCPVHWPADSVPLAELQRAFADLFDRAAADVQGKGYEQDDTLVARRLTCRVGESVYTVAAPFLSDGSLLRRHLLADLAADVGRTVELCDVMIVELRVVVSLDRWPSSPPG